MSSRGKEVSILGTLTLWKTSSLTNDTAELGSSSHFGPSQAFDSMFPGGSAGKESACNVGDLGSIPGLGSSPGEGKGYPLQYSGLENSMDCIAHVVANSWTRLNEFHFLFLF